MPKTNQIQFLTPSQRTPGATYHWKPSPRLRKLGWTNLMLGSDWAMAVQRAIARNTDVEAWLAANAAAPTRAKPPRILRWRDLVASYKADPAFLDLKPKSRAGYASWLNTLSTWAMDGELRLVDLDRAMIIDLRNTLVRDPRKHRTAALLRILRVLCNFAASQGWMPHGLAAEVDIPDAASRKTVIAPADVERLALRAEAMREPVIGLAIRLGFWTFQREGDLLALTRDSWRPVTDLSAFARSVLVGQDGKVMGFRLQQSKTGAWAHVPPPPPLRRAVEAQFARLPRFIGPQGAESEARQHLLARDGEGSAWPDTAFQRAFRRIADVEGMHHVQFRDLRRSGMVMFGELGIEIQFITAISGHAVLGHKKTILDTYMPGNSRFAAEGVAIAWTRWCERIEAELEEAK